MSRRDEDRESSASRCASAPSAAAADRRAPSRAAPRKEWDFSGIDEPSSHGASHLVALPDASADSRRFAASRSHEANDAYVARVAEAFQSLGVAEKAATKREISSRGSLLSGSVAERNDGAEDFGFGKRRVDGASEREQTPFNDVHDAATTTTSAMERFDPSNERVGIRQSSVDASGTSRKARWLRGPVDPAGVVSKVSDLPVTCASLAPTGDFLVVGGTDHAVYAYSVVKDASSTSKAVSTAASELRGGHREWVTCVTHDSKSGQVVSGGMDSRVCYWTLNTHTRGRRSFAHTGKSVDLEGHTGSVSDVIADDGCIASASYDKTVRLWRVGTQSKTNAKCVATLRGHGAPALLLAARETDEAGDAFGLDFASLASGDRGGAVLRWDATTGSLVSKRDAHEGHCTSLRWIKGADPHLTPLLASGGQDGVARFWDDRQNRPVAFVDAHRTARGADGVSTGAVSEIAQCALSQRVVTAGADGRVAVLDMRHSSGETQKNATSTHDSVVLSKRALGDFAYSLCVAPDADVAFVGDGSGNVHCVDVAGCLSGGVPSVAFALKAHRGAARAVVAARDGKLFSAGDDGHVASYAFF